MIREKLPIHKQYLVVSAPVPFKLIANNGTDFVERPAGVWQLDCYKLLPEKFMKNYPVFNLELEYDESGIPAGFTFEYYFTNINLGDSLKGVSGDLVELSGYQFEAIKDIMGFSEDYPSYKVLCKIIHSRTALEFSEVIDIPSTTKKVLYTAFTVVLKDGSRIKSTPLPLFIRDVETVMNGKFEYSYSLDVGSPRSKIRLTDLRFLSSVYKTGFFPSFSDVAYDDVGNLVFKFKGIPSITDVKNIEFFILVE